MSVKTDSAAELITRARLLSGMSKSAMAAAAGTSRAALDSYEGGERIPRFDTLVRALRSTGAELTMSLAVGNRDDDDDDDDDEDDADDSTSLAAYAAALDLAAWRWTWRQLVSDFVANEFVPATARRRRRLLGPCPSPLADHRWDALLAALAEHLAFHAGIRAPLWTLDDERSRLHGFWWPVHGELPSTRSAALAHSPAAFKRRLILVDGREIPRVRR
ncbi:MAG: helix-turn-helix domain-containing protein [Actinobacteria bacterium]|nr:helix-turn-helix domain-containing protein [Actinomycetota bacterium]